MMRAANALRSLLRRASSPWLLAGALLACGDDDADDEQRNAAIAQYVSIVRHSYDDAITDAEKLRDELEALVEKPSADTLAAAREAWIAARPAYLQTEAYRFYEGPIDDPAQGLEKRINAWPLDEGFIDYVKDASGAIQRKGIINDRGRFSTITKDTLIAYNQDGGREKIATGYHAIEFLLWGQDLNNGGPGERPFSDFLGGTASSDPDADRRRQYLSVVGELLIDDLRATRAAWNDGQPYLKRFLANLNSQSLKNMVRGITLMTKEELAGARLRRAYDSQDQEDEHSCFSDNTHNDLKYNLVGIQNVYFGRYAVDDATGLEDLVKTADPALDFRIKNDLAVAENALAALPVPFDQAIRDDASLRKVRSAIDALDALGNSLLLVNSALDL